MSGPKRTAYDRWRSDTTKANERLMRSLGYQRLDEMGVTTSDAWYLWTKEARPADAGDYWVPSNFTTAESEIQRLARYFRWRR